MGKSKKYIADVVNEEKTSETPSVLVEAATKEDELSPNPAGSGFVKQVFIDDGTLPVSGEVNTIYLVAQKVDGGIVGYKKYTWDLATKKYKRVYGSDPNLALDEGEQGVALNEVNAPKEAPEKVFAGEVVFVQEPIIAGKKLQEYIDSEGGVTEQELHDYVKANPTVSGNETNLNALEVGGQKYKVKDVVANPTLVGNEAKLSGLQVGNTKYDVFTEEKLADVPSGSPTVLLGVDSGGNVVNGAIPVGGVVDGAFDEDSENPVQNKVVTAKVNEIDASLQEKANVDGNYPTMTVGVADQLSPYDEESGDDQDEPFSFQATGTGNGTQPDFATGAIALMKEKQGNTVVVNQKVNVVDLTSSGNGIDFTTNSTTKKVTASGTATGTYVTIFSNTGDYIANHKYLVFANVTKNTGNKAVALSTQGSAHPGVNVGITGVGVFAKVSTAATDKVATPFGLLSLQVDETYDLEFTVIVVDLTQWFNGDIPQDLLDNPSNFYRYYNGDLSYNTGELVNANGRYIKCIGMNQWDEEWELGSINTSGQWYDTTGQIRTKNYIKIIPNATYLFHNSATATNHEFGIAWYDRDKNFISWDYTSFNNRTFVAPSNAVFMAFTLYSGYGTTYNNDISINLYYEDEARCLTYEPYEVLTNNDTGTEVLRSAGNVKDYKTPDGTIHRLVGVVDLGSLTWSKQELGNSKYGFTAYLGTIKPIESNSEIPNLACSKYVRKTRQQTYTSNEVGVSMWSTSTYICIYDSSLESGDATAFKTAMSGVYLFYELAEPTTEQGTSYSENLVIDDFGSMDFQGTNGVPQGNLIFYPVDYKAFIDTLYDYTEGTPSELVKQSERTSDKSAQATLDTALQNAIGGTLRQCLCVKETLDFEDTAFVDLGTLDWNVSSLGQATFGVAFADIESFNTPTSIAPILTTGVLNAAKWQDIYNGVVDNAISVDIQTLRVRATGKTLTEFKNSLKGVLLAYKKA